MTKIWKWIKNQFANHVVHIAIIWLVIGCILLIVYSVFTWRGWDWQALDWQVLMGFATWVLAGGIFLAFSQIREARRSTQAQIAMDLFRELRDKKTMAEIRKIYDLPDNYSEPKDEYQKGIIEYLISQLNVLGVLVEKGLIDKELAPDAYAGTTSLRCWYKLHKYIKKGRDDRGYFGVYFEGFARLSLEHFKRKGIEVKFHKKGEEDKRIDLVTKLQEEKLRPRSFKEIKKAQKTQQKSKEKENT